MPAMNAKPSCRTKGFTLIELMIVLLIMAIMTPVVFRFYHEGVKKRFVRLSESSDALQGTRVLFKYLEQDLRHADSLVNAFGALKTDQNTLIVNTMASSERARLLKTAGDLWRESPDKDNESIIVYRLNDSGEIVREVHQGKTMPKSSAEDLPGDVRTTDIMYSQKAESGLVFVPKSFSQTALLSKVEAAEFSFDHEVLEDVSWVRLDFSRTPGSRNIRSAGKFYSIFGVG
jgi:prepilin-type N-terminal cleavage/methylation domain-containing protein